LFVCLIPEIVGGLAGALVITLFGWLMGLVVSQMVGRLAACNRENISSCQRGMMN
jgi:hypothetical protein